MKRKIVLSMSLIVFLNTSALAKDELISIDKVSIDSQVQKDESGIGSTKRVSAKEIKIFSSAELLNPYKAVSLEPGVDIRTNDPFGMDVTHKIRGKSDRNIGETLEGLPLKGIGPGGGLATLMDIENISSVSVEKGAIKADSGFGYGSDNGMVDMKIKKPSKDLAVELKQSLGSYNFSKTYMRVDSGEMADIAKVFVSASLTEADKFKGSGKSPDRKNFAIGVASTSDQLIEWEVYGIYNDEKKHNYRGLTYAQSKDLPKYKNLDYNKVKNGTNDDGNYYDNNKQDFQTYTIIAKLKAPLSSDSSLSFRPYFLNDKGYSYSGNGTNGNVIDWLVDHNTYGGVLEYEKNLDSSKIKLGYWYQEDEPPGPPTSRKIRDSDLNFKKWERVVKAKKNHTFSAPFLTYEHTFDKTIVEAGLKYLWLSSPNLVSYNTTGITDGNYDSALSQASVVDFTLPSNTYELFLPNIGLTHYLNDDSYIKVSYGRNYNTPAYSFGGSMINIFHTKIAKDEAKLQEMWRDLKPEESDNFDIGYSFNGEKSAFEATLFYSKVKNVGGNFYDPVYNLEIFQNSAEAESYGLEVAGEYKILHSLLLKASATYNKYAFTTDIQSASNSYIATKGNQLPDVPLFYGNISAEYNINGYKIAPIVRYLGKRYVDVTHNYNIDANYLVDLSISKDFTIDKHKLEFSLSCTNLLDEEYISTINASDININPNTTYIVGAPRTFFASLGYKY